MILVDLFISGIIVFSIGELPGCSLGGVVRLGSTAGGLAPSHIRWLRLLLAHEASDGESSRTRDLRRRRSLRMERKGEGGPS